MARPLTRRTAWLISFLALAAIASLQGLADASSQASKEQQRQFAMQLNEPLIPSVQSLEFLSLGNKPLVADLLWLDTVQYFGTSSPYATFAALPKLLDTITQLDPQFEYPYEFGLVALPFMNGADAAITLGERAQHALPNNGLLTYYLATVYQINKKDYKKAADYYIKAASLPDAPGAARELAGVSLSRVNGSLNDREVALAFWKTVFEQAKNDDDKQRAQDWYVHLQIVYTLEKLAEEYKTKTGAYPASLQTLVDEGYVREIPTSPIHRQLEYHPDTGKITFEKLAEQ